MRDLRFRRHLKSPSRCARKRLRAVESLERRELFAAEGLDPSFGNGGVVEQVFPGDAAFAQTVAIQPDGKIVVGGAVHRVGTVPGEAGPQVLGASDPVLARYNVDGSPDISFATNGVLSSASAGGIQDVVIDDSGKLLTADIGMTRYNANGTLDTSFGLNGIGASGGSQIAVQSDGKILTDGVDFSRFNPDGTLDTTFGDNGYIEGVGAERFLILPDGGIVTATGNTIRRFTANGKLDTTFADSGTLTLPVPNGELFETTSLLLTADGQIDCVNNLMPSENLDFPPQKIAIFQFSESGILNPAFGDHGETIIASQAPITNAYDAVLEPGGKLVIVGRAGELTVSFAPGNFQGNIFTARLDANGSLDPTWGNGGTSAVTVGSNSEAMSVALTSDGQIVLVGDAVPFGAGPQSHAMVVIRMDGDYNEAFVRRAYLDLLGRAADPAALDDLTAQLDSGALSRGQVVRMIQASGEYDAHIVQEVYAQLLKRPADPSGLASWTAFLQSGGTRAQLEAQILASNEFYNVVSGGNSGTFLNNLFLDLLDRPIDASARAYLTAALEVGVSRHRIVETVLASFEFDQVTVNSLYQEYLGRPADPTGLAAFEVQLAINGSSDQIIAQLVESNEYFNDF